MPIVNGTYQSTPLFQYNPKGASFMNQAQQQVFGDWSSHDMSDYSAFALNRLQSEQDKAFAVEMWNLQNKYNSPAAQMQRFKQAGLNPNLAYTQANAGASFSAPTSKAAEGTHGSQDRAFSRAMTFLQNLRAMAETASGINEAFSRNSLRASQKIATNQKGALDSIRTVKERYDIGLDGTNPDSSLYSSPYAKQSRAKLALTQSQAAANNERIAQIRAMIEMIPDQRARLNALTELDNYRKKILEGQYDAILNISTGYKAWDDVLKLLIFTGAENLGSILKLL